MCCNSSHVLCFVFFAGTGKEGKTRAKLLVGEKRVALSVVQSRRLGRVVGQQQRVVAHLFGPIVYVAVVVDVRHTTAAAARPLVVVAQQQQQQREFAVARSRPQRQRDYHNGVRLGHDGPVGGVRLQRPELLCERRRPRMESVRASCGRVQYFRLVVAAARVQRTDARRTAHDVVAAPRAVTRL